MSAGNLDQRFICVTVNGESDGQELEVMQNKIQLHYIQQYFSGCTGLSYKVTKPNMLGTISRACKIDKNDLVEVPADVYDFQVTFPSKL